MVHWHGPGHDGNGKTDRSKGKEEGVLGAILRYLLYESEACIYTVLRSLCLVGDQVSV